MCKLIVLGLYLPRVLSQTVHQIIKFSWYKNLLFISCSKTNQAYWFTCTSVKTVQVLFINWYCSSTFKFNQCIYIRPESNNKQNILHTFMKRATSDNVWKSQSPPDVAFLTLKEWLNYMFNWYCQYAWACSGT